MDDAAFNRPTLRRRLQRSSDAFSVEELELKARWILENPNPSPRLAHTLIAGWWPTRYYLVTTIERLGATGNSPIKELIRSIPGSDPQDEYLVQVFKCNRSGVPKIWARPYYERSYRTKRQSLEAHSQIVRLLSKGKRLQRGITP
jgi:hypothetical protein